MSDHELKQIIAAAARASTAEDFDTLMDFYSEDATLVVKPGLNASGKLQIRKAFDAIADHFKHGMAVTQGNMEVIEGGDTALVIMETVLNTVDADGAETSSVRRATYVFRRNATGKWLCVIANSYGTDLLQEAVHADATLHPFRGKIAAGKSTLAARLAAATPRVPDLKTSANVHKRNSSASPFGNWV